MTVELILALVAGLVTGVLIALWVDSQTLVRRVQEANAAKSKAQEDLQRFQIQHQAVEQQIRVPEPEITMAAPDPSHPDASHYEETIARQLAEIEASREQLQTSIRTNETLRHNLEEGQGRLEELEGNYLAAEEKLETAVAENNRLLGDVQLMEGEIAELEAKIGELSQTQTLSSDHEQKIVAAEAEIVALSAEKETAEDQLQQAEIVAAEQGATIEMLREQLAETDTLREQVTAANEKLQTAESHIEALQNKMDDVQTKMHYSGKNQLQLIKGIGPAYARRLNDFGIQTFTDLAECDPDQLADIIKKKSWQSVNMQDWIDEAKALAARLGPDD